MHALNDSSLASSGSSRLARPPAMKVPDSIPVDAVDLGHSSQACSEEGARGSEALQALRELRRMELAHARAVSKELDRLERFAFRYSWANSDSVASVASADKSWCMELNSAGDVAAATCQGAAKLVEVQDSERKTPSKTQSRMWQKHLSDSSNGRGGGTWRDIFFWRRQARRVVGQDGCWFDWIMGAVIVLSMLSIGLEIQNTLEKQSPTWLLVLNHFLLACFLLELCLRVLADRGNYLRTFWGFLDTTCVILGILVDWILKPLSPNDIVRIDSWSLLRIFRLLRLVKAIRLLHVCRELGALCDGLLTSARTVLSASVLLLMTVYILACMGVEAIVNSETLQANEDTRKLVEERFSSLWRTMLTLLSFTNADSISGFYEPMIAENLALAPFFALAWVLVTVALMNLVTAVIVDAAIEQHKQSDKQQQAETRKRVKLLVPQIQRIFETLDKSGDGEISLDEVNLAGLELPSDLANVVSEDRLKDLFQVLDIDGSGTVDKEEFVDGVMSLALQNVPVETTQTLQLLRSQQKSLAEMGLEMKETLRICRAQSYRLPL